jgi:hypothetical protein
VGSTFPNQPESGQALLGLADAAPCRAKSRGRNRLVNPTEVTMRMTSLQATAGRKHFSHYVLTSDAARDARSLHSKTVR